MDSLTNPERAPIFPQREFNFAQAFLFLKLNYLVISNSLKLKFYQSTLELK